MPSPAEYKCKICGKRVSSLKYLKKHEANHSQIRKIKEYGFERKNYKCFEGCNISVHTSRNLREHLIQQHQVEMKTVSMEFSSFEDFQIWLKYEWRTNNNKFIRPRGITRTSKQYNIEKYEYNCAKSGKIRCKPREKHDPKKRKRRSGKLDFGCTSQIFVKKNKSTGACSVLYYSTHYGHDILVDFSTDVVYIDETNNVGYIDYADNTNFENVEIIDEKEHVEDVDEMNNIMYVDDAANVECTDNVEHVGSTGNFVCIENTYNVVPIADKDNVEYLQDTYNVEYIEETENIENIEVADNVQYQYKSSNVIMVPNNNNEDAYNVEYIKESENIENIEVADNVQYQYKSSNVIMVPNNNNEDTYNVEYIAETENFENIEVADNVNSQYISSNVNMVPNNNKEDTYNVEYINETENVENIEVADNVKCQYKSSNVIMVPNNNKEDTYNVEYIAETENVENVEVADNVNCQYKSSNVNMVPKNNKADVTGNENNLLESSDSILEHPNLTEAIINEVEILKHNLISNNYTKKMLENIFLSLKGFNQLPVGLKLFSSKKVNLPKKPMPTQVMTEISIASDSMHCINVAHDHDHSYT